MTRRDYVLLAESFRETMRGLPTLSSERLGVIRAAQDMAFKLARKNVRFDQVMFLRNCGMVRLISEQEIPYG